MLQCVARASVSLACLVVMAPALGRPAMSRAGGAGRPAVPHAAARPMPAARPQMPAARPVVSTPRPSASVPRPQVPNFQRPSVGALQRPNLTRPSLPNAEQRPLGQPAQLPRPGLGMTRPALLPGTAGKPVAMPGRLPGGPPGAASRPGGGFAARPTPPGPLPGTAKPLGPKPGLNPPRPPAAGRPGLGATTRPATPNRPGAGNRPAGGNRPTPLPGELGGGPRPGSGGNRPSRPGIGGDRPGIGNGNSIWNSGNNWFVGNDINVGGWNGGGWGYPGGSWSNAWHHGCVNPHYSGWYNGCWGGNWGGGWWAPFAVGAATWGVLATATNWGLGYGQGYANPYYAAVPAAVVAASPYDYSQPVTVTNYATTVDGDTTAVAEGGAADETAGIVDEALARFKAEDYAGALTGFDKVLRATPDDSVIHEARALALFALGRYAEAAATLNSVLAAAPGMDWTTLSNLYGSVDDYTAQLRALEEFCRSHREDAGAHFVLAYHYLVGGHTEAALKPLRIVVAKQPNDVVAKRLLDSITPPADDVDSAGDTAAAQRTAPETDLVGTWQATGGQETIRLSIGEDFTFTWSAAAPGKPAVTLSGTVETTADTLALIAEKAGTLAGRVSSQGPDAFEFSPPGAARDAKPLLFRRQP